MVTFVALQIWFVITALGYTALVAKSSDGIRLLPWWSFPVLERDHFTVPILKVLPTIAVLLTSLFAFNYSIHWFTVSYAIFLLLMVIVDYGIVAQPRRFMYLALAAHLLSEMTLIALVITTSLSDFVIGYYLAAALLGWILIRPILQTTTAKERGFILAYTVLIVVLAGSFIALATSNANFPFMLRLCFAATALAIGTTDYLWACWEFGKQGYKWAVIGSYYPAIWLIAIDMILFAKYTQVG